MLDRATIRALAFGILTLCGICTVQARAQSGPCTGDAASKAKLIAATKAAVWHLYPESKNVFISGMTKDLISFYGANTHVFYWDLLKLQASFGGDYQAASQHLGTGTIFGDAHFGNLGEYTHKGNKYYAINDVDDVTTAPRIYDLMRAAVGTVIRFPKVAPAILISGLVEGYAAGPGKMALAEPTGLSISRLIPEKHLEEPEPPAASWDAAELAFRGMTGLSRPDFDKNCKKFVYVPFHGGSSIGLPRFRVTCNGLTYELKACTASAVDQVRGLAQTCNKGQTIAQLATQLSPSFVGGFIASNSLSGIREFAPFGFYGHFRTSDDPHFDPSDADDVLKIVKQFGKAIGAGHAKTMARPLTWTLSQTQQLQRALLQASVPMLASLKQDYATIPNCL